MYCALLKAAPLQITLYLRRLRVRLRLLRRRRRRLRFLRRRLLRLLFRLRPTER